MADTTEGVALPDSPVGRHVAWFLAHSATRGAGLTEVEVAQHMSFPPPWTPQEELDRFKTADDRPAVVFRVRVISPRDLEVGLDYGDDRPWSVAFTVEPTEPHRIVRMFWTRAIAEDIVIRPAEAGDGPGLNDLEIRAPMQLGQTTLTYDRGDDFLAFGRLMGDNVCFVAARDGQLLGLACGTSHLTRIGGRDYRVMLLHHLRVPVEHRKGGIFSTLNGQVFAAFDRRSDGAYGYTALDNAEGMRIGGPGTWSVTVLRCLLDCRQLAGPSSGRPATAADVDTVVDILNRSHRDEEMYLPYTTESFAERMARAPDLYTWERVLVGEDAVVGVWPSGLVVPADGDGPTRSVRAVALDHGFVPGPAGESEFERLLRSSCTRLLDQGHTELMVLTAEGARSQKVVTGLARRVDPYSLRMAVPEPPGTAVRGLYVDAVYF